MSAIMDTDFPAWLTATREKFGWSQSELSRRAEVSRQVISDYEGYKRKYYDDEILRNIARAFNLSEVYVLQKAGKIKENPEAGDEWADEMSDKIKLIPPGLRGYAEKLINAMLDGEEKEKEVRRRVSPSSRKI